MKCKTNKSFTSLLNNSPDLLKFVAKVKQLAQINQIVSSKLEPSLANNCRVANLRNGTLTLTTTSPAWKHKLRFSSINLLSTLRSDPRWRGLRSIEIRIDYLPKLETAKPINPNKPNTISANSAKLLIQTAEFIVNPKLAAALRKLSARSKN